ncbi:FadR/GntR family transcriptional regulator [Kushneria aurantia]|uniref:FadR/GntR family transcriptional regulator n=1 Tax=Kushneria aurantia TaxID=504092 RepID=A0ABV6G162_9GAMM|nr:FCD domain-containing protein [Kushneria aurantia]
MTGKVTSGDNNLADQLMAAILGGQYQPGDFIPKEMAICRDYGLSRNQVRHHLATLVRGGIIERISGHGSRVRDFSQWQILDPAVTDWIARYGAPHPDIQREVLHFRLTVEPWVAMMAATSATAHDLVAIEEAFEGMQCCLRETGSERYNDQDVAFHIAIYRATHNIVWSQLSHVLRPSIHMLVVRSNIGTHDPLPSLDRHRELMNAIRMRQPEKARQAAVTILEGTALALGVEISDPGDSLPALLSK